MMDYPSKNEVKCASREQLCQWWRFLPSPGHAYIGRPNFSQKMEEQAEVMNLIGERMSEVGGFSAEISKKVGW